MARNRNRNKNRNGSDNGSKYERKQNQTSPQKGNSKRNVPKRPARLKDISDKEMARRFETDMGENFTLSYLKRISFPYYKLRIALISAGKPEKDTQQVHSILLRLVGEGINSEEAIIEFLGLQPPFFVINELYALVREGALVPANKDKYALTAKGDEILNGTAWLSMTETIEYEFVIDGTTGKLFPSREFFSNSGETELVGIFEGARPPFKWLNEHWVELCQIYQNEYAGSELVDFAKDKRSILWGEKFFEDHFVFGYAQKENPHQPLHFRVRDLNQKQLEDKVPVVKELIGDKSDLLFDEDIADLVMEYEPVLSKERDQIEAEKASIASNNYRELKNFEIRDEVIKAIRTAQTAILIESPWIRQATERLLPDLRAFLKRGGKLCLLYGIDGDKRNKPHKSMLAQLETLKSDFRDQFYLVNLPSHFENNFLETSGTHRKILIKDTELTIKGSYNYLSNNAEEGQKFAAEEATVFMDRSAERWKEIFREYHLAEKFLDFL